MKLKGNGGYQIIDFEGQAPNTLDVDFFENTIARGKPLWINNLVVDGETYSGVGSLKKTLTSIIVAIATLNIVIALSDGTTTYEASGGGSYYELNITIDDSGELSADDKAKLDEALAQDKPIIIKTPTYYSTSQGEWKDGESIFYANKNDGGQLSCIICFEFATTETFLNIQGTGTYEILTIAHA